MEDIGHNNGVCLPPELVERDETLSAAKEKVERFARAAEKSGLTCQLLEPSDRFPVYRILVTFGKKDPRLGKEMAIDATFGQDARTVRFLSSPFGTEAERRNLTFERLAKALELCNRINARSRWVCFVVEAFPTRGIYAKADAVVSDVEDAETFVGMVRRMMESIGNEYPTIREAVLS